MGKTKVAILWDESFLWGLMAYRGLAALGQDPVILTSSEIREGALAAFDILFVPGGWASDKTLALGEGGREAIREFVRSGGSYLGLCGGAGLALDVEGGLALTHATRVPTSRRVPSFSGDVDMEPALPHHPIWHGIAPPYRFHAWWPGQFHLGLGHGVKVVARYASPGKDFSLADLDAGDVYRYDAGWEKWEVAYGINLDPARLLGEPAIIESEYGEGKALLSYLHLETPGCKKGNHALLNVLEYLKPERRAAKGPGKRKGRLYGIEKEAVRASKEVMEAADEFIDFGYRNFLWYWRNDWMLQWRRGVRGVEYSMLYVLAREVAANLKKLDRTRDPDLPGKIIAIKARLIPFFEEAKQLLMRERFAMMGGGMSSIRSHDPEVLKLRERLFSSSKRFGGEFKRLLDMLDEAVLATLGH